MKRILFVISLVAGVCHADPAPSYQVIQDNGTTKHKRLRLNFVGATVSDDSVNNRTNVTVNALACDTCLTTSGGTLLGDGNVINVGKAHGGTDSLGFIGVPPLGNAFTLSATAASGLDILSGGERMLALWGTIPFIKVTESANQRFFFGGRMDGDLFLSSVDVLGSAVSGHSINPVIATLTNNGVDLGIAAGDAKSGGAGNGGTMSVHAGAKDGAGNHGQLLLGTITTKSIDLGMGLSSTSLNLLSTIITPVQITDSSSLVTTMFDLKTAGGVELVKVSTGSLAGVYLKSVSGNSIVTVDDNLGVQLQRSGGATLLVDTGVHVSGGSLDAAGGSANHATCWKGDGKTLGYCSDIVGASGTCTCN